MKFAYADPPYPGQAKRHYSDQPICCEVNHEILIGFLCSEYPDGWALSTSSPALHKVLPLCPPYVRVMAWVKPFCSFKPGVGVAYAWEPVIVSGGRKRTRKQKTIRDWVPANITIKKGLHGAKPVQFYYWILDVLNYFDGDTIEDIFPGIGTLSKILCFERYKQETLC